MKILFLHGSQSFPGGVKPTYLKDHGHTVINPKLPDEDFAEAVRITQAEFDRHRPDVIVGSSRGGAVAMNINIGTVKLVLLCPAWKKWGKAKYVKPSTVILHSRADDVIPFAESEQLARNSGATLIEIGSDHRLADPESLAAMLEACGNPRSPSRSVPEKERRDAEKTGGLVRKKLLEIMDLQADIDALLRDKHPTPFGSGKWKDARPEILQRLVSMTAIQFLLFEPVDWVAGNDELTTAADNFLKLLSTQLKTLKAK
jgi:hypothetical protein